MANAIRLRLDTGLLVVLGIASLAVWPFLSRPSLPTLTDAEMHVYRAAEVQYAIQDGTLYPRWAPDFYYGYGYPVFNYYSPLSYHLAAWYALATRTDVVAGIKFVLVAAAYLGAAGMYLFARNRWSAEAGVVAAAAWAFSPYILFIDPHARGDAPEAFALGLAPLLMWAFDGLLRRGMPRYLALACVVLAALILSHPLMSLAVYGFLLAFLCWELLISPLVPSAGDAEDVRRHLPKLAATLVLGLALAAFYWLPAGLERSAVRLQNVAGPGFFDFREHFISPSELAAPSPLMDMGATQPDFRFNLGVVQWSLALLGALTIFAPRLRRLDTMFFAFAGIAFMYVMTRASLGFWEAIPPMSFFQFPSRFLGPAALALAPLAGQSVNWLRLLPAGKRWMSGGAAAGVLALGLGALPVSFPPQWDGFGEVTPLRMLSVELQGRARGTTSADDFLPVDVLVVPAPQDSVLDGYKKDWRAVEKFNRVTLPEGAQATLLDSRAEYDRIRVNTPVSFVFRVYRFYFAGWTARVDGQPVEIEVAQPDGFITFWVPAGEHVVEVTLEPTPARRLGWLTSILAAVVLVVVVAFGVARRPRPVAQPLPAPALNHSWMPALAASVALLFGLRLAAGEYGMFRYFSSGSEVLVAQHKMYANLGSEIALLGFDVPDEHLRAGMPLPVTLYWKALQPPAANYRVFVHLVGRGGVLHGQSDKLNPAGFPTERWPTDKYVRDEHTLVVGDDLPPGVYYLAVGLWDGDTGQRLLAYDRQGNILDDNIRLPVELLAGG